MKEVRDVRAGKIFAGITFTFFIKRREILAEARVRDVDSPFSCIERARARLARWRDAVKCVAPVLNCGKEVGNSANSEQVPWLVFW